MTRLIFYRDNKITRIMTSSRPKSKWALSTYGLDKGEQMVLLDKAELPDDFTQSGYHFDGKIFTRIEPKPVRDLATRVSELETKVEKLERK